jgi:hypothetical protein
MEYDQRVIIRFLWNKEIDANQIAARLQTQFDEHAYKLRTVRFRIVGVWFGRQNLHDEIRTGRPSLDDLDAKTLAILDKSPFESVCSIAERLSVGHAIVFEHLHVSIGFKSFHLCRVPYLLTNNLRQKRKEHASAMLPFLYAAQRDGWHHLVTGDEYLSFFNISRHRMWTLSRDDVATTPRLDVQSTKGIFIIIYRVVKK